MDYSQLTQALEEKLGIIDLSQEMKEEILMHIGDTIIERSMLLIAESLSEDESKHAAALLQAGDVGRFYDFLHINHPELDALIVDVSNEVIDEFAQGIALQE
jgi:hypothetical protein